MRNFFLYLLIISPIYASNETETTEIFNVIKFTNKSDFTKTLAPGKIDIHYKSLSINDALDLARISISLPNPKDFLVYGKDPIIEMMVSNGRDSLTLNLPVIQNNGDLAWDEGKLLNPLLPNDFGSQKKNKNQPQTLFITVQSRLNVEILYKINIRFLDRSQYVVRWKDGNSTHEYLHQHLTFVKPIGYYINVVEQKMSNLKITLLSEDDICATLVTVPNNLSIYENSDQLEKFERRLTLTRRADVYFSENELSQLTDFRIFVFVNRNDQECDSEAANHRKDQNRAKKLSFFFEKIDKSSYFLPISVMFLVFLAPIFGVAGYFWMTKVNKIIIRSGGSGILIQLNNSSDIENSTAPELPELPEVEEFPTQPNLLQSSMLKYPLAIILPIFMHAISEYHKFTQTSMANRDEICFHNLACAKPFWEFRAFNNILSNFGYFVCGSVFVGFTLVKKGQMPKNSGVYDCSDLDVLIGFLLVLQSIGSSAYHICPNVLAFQFDTPCIQIISCLIIIRQSIIRHKSPSPHISNAIFVGVFAANFAISALASWIFVRFAIAIFHFSTIFAIIRWKLRETEHFLVFSAIFGILNAVLALTYLIFTKIVHLNHILTFLTIFNCTAYLLYYTLMKIWKNEEILKKTAIFGGLAVVFWGFAMVFYLQGDIDWTISPAKSRALNKPCLIFDFFGSHDMWHVFSAFATLFTFFYVSLVDDNLSNVPRNCLNVF
ncbi:unnamed protein product [Caenorhabditis angaria]|uniref:Uncharacterized protein n=1 Tax=Caenorhabditis angaria TaxID=860376 RepID=A0A9P1N5C8_9PELO|nr:unnamed protein product [Caenorhabditis angaria]